MENCPGNSWPRCHPQFSPARLGHPCRNAAVAPMHIQDFIHRLAAALALAKDNHFSTTLRMVGIRDLYPVNMGITMGIRTPRSLPRLVLEPGTRRAGKGSLA